jgi:hypothetical protein
VLEEGTLDPSALKRSVRKVQMEQMEGMLNTKPGGIQCPGRRASTPGERIVCRNMTKGNYEKTSKGTYHSACDSVVVIFCCQGAGEGRRMTVWRLGGGLLEELPASRYRQRQSKTMFSSDFPVRLVSLRISSSNWSVLSSSSSASSCSTGSAFSYRSSATILTVTLQGYTDITLAEGCRRAGGAEVEVEVAVESLGVGGLIKDCG